MVLHSTEGDKTYRKAVNEVRSPDSKIEASLMMRKLACHRVVSSTSGKFDLDSVWYDMWRRRSKNLLVGKRNRRRCQGYREAESLFRSVLPGTHRMEQLRG